MIRYVRKRYRWGDEDISALAPLVGPEIAAGKQTAPNEAFLKAARTRHVLLSDKLTRRLHQAERERIDTRTVRQRWTPDFPGRKNWWWQDEALDYFNSSGRRSFLLADQPGVGKTAVAIRWCERVVKPFGGRILVVALNSAKDQWAREIKRFGDGLRPVTILNGRVADQNEQALNEGYVIAHWEALVHARDGITAQPQAWDAVVLDEAHEVRNRETQRAETVTWLANNSRYRLALTGHPFLKAPYDLWTILNFLYPKKYTSYWYFFNVHVDAVPKQFGGYEVKGTRDPDFLRWELEPFTLRREKREVFPDNPPITRIFHDVDLPSGHRREYDRLKKEFFVELEGREKKLPILNMLSRTTRLRQYLVDPGLIGSSKRAIKYDAILDVLHGLDGPAVVFTSFRRAAVRLAKFLKKKKLRASSYHGGRTTTERTHLQRKFVDGKLDALIMVTKIGGASINLGGYGYVIFLDPPWRWGLVEQAEGRVDRPSERTGELTPTTSFSILTSRSYETRMSRMIETQGSMFDEIFSTNQLKEML